MSITETTKSQIGAMESQLREWGTKLDDLVAKADEARDATKAEYRNRIDELKAKHQAAQAKLDELKAAGHENWETLKAGATRVWNELEDAFKKLKN